MNKELIKKEMKELGIEDNPFDLILYNSLKIVERIIYGRENLRNKNIAIERSKKDLIYEDIISHIDDMKTQYSIIDKLSDDTLELCRKTSFCHLMSNFENLIFAISNTIDDIQISPTRGIFPARNLNFEKFRLGEDSDEFKNILRIRDIADNSEEFMFMEQQDLSDLLSVNQESEDYCLHFIPKDKYDNYKNIIDKYNLTIGDLFYLINYSHRKKVD